jgi:CheY-like chemotaxis protein
MALAEIARHIADALFSDLNMPRMSGFELRTLVRRQFPMIPLILMSGAFSGKQVPTGVSGDGFYEKRSHPVFLVQMLSAMARPKPRPREIASASANKTSC